MKDLKIRQLQNKRDTYRYKAHQSGLESDWKIFRDVRNKLKVIWSTIHRILHPNPKPINEDPEKLNAYFSKLAEELTGKESIPPDQLTRIIDNMPLTTGEKFQLREVPYGEVKKALLSVRKDCSFLFL